MGCETYHYMSEIIRFSEMDDTVPCLCTFPHNDLALDMLKPLRVRALAMLGAAVVLIQRGELEGPVYLPDALPRWLIEALEQMLPEDAPNPRCSRPLRGG
jgi:hypothetical protein